MATSALGNAVASAPGLALQQQQEQAQTQVMQGQAATSQMQVGGEQAYNKLMAQQMQGYQPGEDQFANIDTQAKAMQQVIPQLAAQGFGEKAQALGQQVRTLQQQKMQLGYTGMGKAAQIGDTAKMLEIGQKAELLPPNVAKIELDPETDAFVGRDKDGNVVTGMDREAAEHMGYTNEELAQMETKKFMANMAYNRGVDVAGKNAEGRLEQEKLRQAGGLAKADLTGEYSIQKQKLANEAAIAKAGKQATAQGGAPVEPSSIPDNVTGRDALKYVPDSRKATVWAIVEGRQKMPSGVALKTPWGEAVDEEVNKVDPAWSEQKAQIRQAFTTGKDGQNRAALNTASVHLDAYMEAMRALQNGTLVPGNDLYNKLSTILGGPAPTSAAAVRAAVAGEQASALKGNATDKEIDHILGTMKEGASNEQFMEGGKASLNIMRQKLNTYQERYNEKIPSDTTWNAVLPSAKVVFDKYGIGAGQTKAAPAQTKAPEHQSQPQGLPKNTDTDLYHVVSGKNIHQHYDPAKGWTEELMK
jgi:hypothetical protein